MKIINCSNAIEIQSSKLNFDDVTDLKEIFIVEHLISFDGKIYSSHSPKFIQSLSKPDIEKYHQEYGYKIFGFHEFVQKIDCVQ